jgi:hypothetical protein
MRARFEFGAGLQQPRTLAAPTRSGPPARLVVKRPSLGETVAGSALDPGVDPKEVIREGRG